MNFTAQLPHTGKSKSCMKSSVKAKSSELRLDGMQNDPVEPPIQRRAKFNNDVDHIEFQLEESSDEPNNLNFGARLDQGAFSKMSNVEESQPTVQGSIFLKETALGFKCECGKEIVTKSWIRHTGLCKIYKLFTKLENFIIQTNSNRTTSAQSAQTLQSLLFGFIHNRDADFNLQMGD